MPSWQMRGVALFIRLTRKRRYAAEAGGHRMLAEPKGTTTPPGRLRRRHAVTSRSVAGHEVHTVRPLGEAGRAAVAPTVVYLHGGAYVSEIAAQHWSLVAELAEETGAAVVVPHYGLAPQHTATDAFTMLDELLRGLDPGVPVHLAGDSAGGGLALALAQRWQESYPRLAGLTLIAPWLDLEMKNPGIDAVEPHDPWLTRPGLRPAAAAWAGDLALDDPRVSPVNGPLETLPPTLLLVGDRDITVPDCRLLRDRSGGRLDYVEVPGAIHVHPLLPTPEGREGRRLVVEHVRRTARTP